MRYTLLLVAVGALLLNPAVTAQNPSEEPALPTAPSEAAKTADANLLCSNATGGCLGQGVEYPFIGSKRLLLTGKEIIMTTNIKLKPEFNNSESVAQFVSLRNRAVQRFKRVYRRNPFTLGFENMLFQANPDPTATFGPLRPGFTYFDVGVILVARNSQAVELFRSYFSQQPEVTSTLPWIETDVRATDAR